MLSRSDTIDALRILAAKLSNLDEVAKALEQFRDLEEQERLLRKRTEEALSLTVLAEADLACVQDSVRAARETAKKVTAEADDLRSEALRVLQAAKEQAAQIIDAARVQANQAAAARDEAEAQLAALNNKIAEARRVIKGIVELGN